MDNFKVIKIFNNVSDLGLVQSYLESKDIRSFALDETIAQVYLPQAVGGVRLVVLDEDAERAIEALIEGGFATKEDYEVPEVPDFLVHLYDKLRAFFGCKDK